MTNQSKTRKAPPPIVFILMGLIIFGGTKLLKQNSQQVSNLLPSIAQPQLLKKSFSLGEHLLIMARVSARKFSYQIS